jgi:hypothetical protein
MEYVNAFCRRQSLEFSYWVADEPGSIAACGDYFFNFRDIVFDVDTHQPKGLILEWYDEVLSHEGQPINYYAYAKGLRFSDLKHDAAMAAGMDEGQWQAAAELLEKSLGACSPGNDYVIRAEQDGSFWIYHQAVGSGEPFMQWVESVLESCSSGN